MKRKQIVLHSVAKQLFVTGGESQHGLKERPKEEYGTGRNKLLGEKYSKQVYGNALVEKSAVFFILRY